MSTTALVIRVGTLSAELCLEVNPSCCLCLLLPCSSALACLSCSLTAFLRVGGQTRGGNQVCRTMTGALGSTGLESCWREGTRSCGNLNFEVFADLFDQRLRFGYLILGAVQKS